MLGSGVGFEYWIKYGFLLGILLWFKDVIEDGTLLGLILGSDGVFEYGIKYWSILRLLLGSWVGLEMVSKLEFYFDYWFDQILDLKMVWKIDLFLEYCFGVILG